MLETAFLFLMLSGSTKSQVPEALPAPPSGYAWHWVSALNAGFLRPDGWFVKEMEKGSTYGVFITAEEIKPPGRFKTGLSVNAVRNVRQRHGVNPTQYAMLMLEKAKLTHTIIREWDRDMGSMQAKGFLYDLNHGGEQVRIFNLMIANNETGTFYLVLFESPVTSWEDAYRLAEPILQQLYLHPEQ